MGLVAIAGGREMNKRLTNKETKIKLSDTKRYDLQDHKMFTKLSELEDIEDGLSTDLIIIFKALENGFYYKEEGAIVYISKDDLLLSSGAIHFAGKGLIFAGLFLSFKDYGKTWALTKEELLND